VCWAAAERLKSGQGPAYQFATPLVKASAAWEWRQRFAHMGRRRGHEAAAHLVLRALMTRENALLPECL